MNDLDYSGDMDFFQNQLARHGISKEELNMNRYSGLTFRELQGIVNYAIFAKAEKEAKEAKNGD